VDAVAMASVDEEVGTGMMGPRVENFFTAHNSRGCSNELKLL